MADVLQNIVKIPNEFVEKSKVLIIEIGVDTAKEMIGSVMVNVLLMVIIVLRLPSVLRFLRKGLISAGPRL